MAGFDEYRLAAKTRDIIRLIVRKEINRLRPAATYGTVISINRTNRTCEVRFPEDIDDETSVVGMGSIQPSEVGQTVRVGGVVGDRYIDDVMGPPYIWS